MRTTVAIHEDKDEEFPIDHRTTQLAPALPPYVELHVGSAVFYINSVERIAHLAAEVTAAFADFLAADRAWRTEQVAP